MTFDPNQPRDPKGVPTGGQWTDTEDIDSAADRELLMNLELAEIGYAEGDRLSAGAWLHGKGDADVTTKDRQNAKRDVITSIAESLAAHTDISDDDLRRFVNEYGVVPETPKPPPAGSSPAVIAQWMKDLHAGKLDEAWLAALSRAELAKKSAQAIVDQWANTSGDSNARSIAMQLSVANLMDFQEHRPLSWDRNATGKAEGLYLRNSKVLDAAMNHIYDRTQQELAAAKIETVEVYRGMAVPRESVPGTLGKVNVGAVRLQPLSSFSARPETAHQFAFENEDIPENATTSILMAVRVPRTQVFSTPKTGLGALMESEFVLRGDFPTRAAWIATQKDRDVMWFPQKLYEARRNMFEREHGLAMPGDD